ncbi:MAG: DoxX family protein [Proteobacteria bacterium]|nr:DoxX family protein [Pseudomonadota bacterium]
MSNAPATAPIGCPICTATAGSFSFIFRTASRLPYAILAIPLRLAVATVFWNSAMTKLANWDTTLSLFTDEYKVPLLAPETAAHFATAIELTTPVLLVAGLMTRAASLVLLGMVAVIEIFVYPQAWPTHIQWAAMLLILLSRGAGTYSLDNVIGRWMGCSTDKCTLASEL